MKKKVVKCNVPTRLQCTNVYCVGHTVRVRILKCNQKIITRPKSTSRHGNRCSIYISSATYPSSKWVTENHDQFAGQRTDDQSHKDNFAITSLDSSRRNKPQTSQIFHIKRINKKVIFLKKIQEIPNINWMYIHVHTYYTSTFRWPWHWPVCLISSTKRKNILDTFSFSILHVHSSLLKYLVFRPLNSVFKTYKTTSLYSIVQGVQCSRY